ncbi:MAG: GNAT family N-acetyltransferase [Bacteroidota bacterium]|nr:GNAT family N-acetyltransferase [Bacteroidota bacterium]
MLEANFEPFPELQTERLLLRRVKIEDAEEILKLRSDESVMKYIGRPIMKTLGEAIDFFNLVNESLITNNGITWAITLKENPGKLIGTIGHWRLKKEHYRAEVGYMLQHDYWHRGIMKEALLKVIDYGFDELNLHSIEANINPANAASAVILEATGFVKEAYFKEDFFYNGVFYDTVIYSKLKSRT